MSSKQVAGSNRNTKLGTATGRSTANFSLYADRSSRFALLNFGISIQNKKQTKY